MQLPDCEDTWVLLEQMKQSAALEDAPTSIMHEPHTVFWGGQWHKGKTLGAFVEHTLQLLDLYLH